MKNLILLIAVLVVSACCTTPTKPVKELILKEKVIGTYEFKEGGDTYRAVLLENGIWKDYKNGKRVGGECDWGISKEGKLHATNHNGVTGILRINNDGSITHIAYIPKGGKREDYPKEEQSTYKRIK